MDLQAYEKGQTPDLQEFDKRLIEIERMSGRGPFWLYAKAIRTLMQSKKTDPQLLAEARGYLQDAMEARKDWSAPTVLAGKICEMQDDREQALELYVRAVYHMGERDGDVISRTVKLLVARGHREDIDEAKQLFDYLEMQKSPLLGEMSQDYVFVKVFTYPIGTAEKEVDKSVAAGSKNYQDFLRQGQLYGVLTHRLKLAAISDKRDWKADAAMIGMGQKAVNALSHAIDLNPQSDDSWFAMVQILVNVGQANKAKPLIGSAESALKGDKAPLTLAICCDS